MSNFSSVKKFMETFGQEVKNKAEFPSEKIQDLRISLIEEELSELKEAIKNKDIKEVADALTDILYVTYGAGHAFGIDLDKCFDEVQRSNMSKLDENGKPIFNEHGKVLKGPKLTKISPNKTFTGAFGSILLTIVIMNLAFYLITQKTNYLIILIAIITSIACQAGDLFFSFLKRKAKIKLNDLHALGAFLICFVVFFLSFIFPVLQMLYWTIIFPKNYIDLNITNLLLNTFHLVLLTSLILIFFAFLSNYGNRVTRSKLLSFLSTFSISGYAMPGVILAVAFITFISWLDNNIVKFLDLNSIKKIFIGSIMGLIIVYFIRFYSLAFNGIKSGYERINRSIDESSYLLGYSKFKTFSGIHVPYLKNSIFLIGILITIEIIKELPITLILRPFNFETFATTAYIFASQDLLEAAAVPSLFLILIASLFILITSRYVLKD